MKVVIMGCSRVGARLAAILDEAGHDVTVLDIDSHSFVRLPAGFKGTTLEGNGIDVDDLKKAGIEKADAFFAVTQGDNRNIMAAQIARTIFNVRKPVCRIYDPMRQEIYRGMGLDTISATAVITEMLASKLESAGA